MKEFCIEDYKAKALVCILCIWLLEGLKLDIHSYRRACRDVAIDSLKELLREVRRDVPDEELEAEKNHCWNGFQRMLLPDWLRKGWLNTLQYWPNVRRRPESHVRIAANRKVKQNG